MNSNNTQAQSEPYTVPLFERSSTLNGNKPSTPPPPPEPENNTLAGLKFTDAIAFNVQAEYSFCALIIELLDAGEVLTPATVYQEAAYELNISVATAKRYLIKHTARRAFFGIDKNGRVFAK